MAPTSSILPIKDAVAERRLYFSMLGLLLIVVDFLNRSKLDRKQLTVACSAVVFVLAAATWVRAGVWADPVALWTDTVAKSPDNRRAHFQLAYADGRRPSRSGRGGIPARLTTRSRHFRPSLDWAWLTIPCISPTKRSPVPPVHRHRANRRRLRQYRQDLRRALPVAGCSARSMPHRRSIQQRHRLFLPRQGISENRSSPRGDPAISARPRARSCV